MFVLQIFTTAGGKSFNPNTWHLTIFFHFGVLHFTCMCCVKASPDSQHLPLTAMLWCFVSYTSIWEKAQCL